jgi:hypothetical protein
MYVCLNGHVVHTGVDMCVYPDRCHAWIQSPIHSSKCIYICVCMDIHLYLDACTSERHRDARVGVRLRRVRARVRPRGSHLPQGTITAPNASVRLSRACGCVCVHAWPLSIAAARSAARLPIGARRARAARARDARQVHPHDEGDGAPRVARPVQALGGTVRPRRRPAAVRVRGGAGAALLRVRCRALGAGPWHAALDAAAAALPVVGRRARARMAGARSRPARGPGWAGAARDGRTVGAQVGVQQRARGAAGGGRVAEPEETVSARAAALTRPRRCADAWQAASGARTTRAPLGTCVCVWVYVAVYACVCVRMRACAECVPARGRGHVGVYARGGSGGLLIVCHSVYVRLYVCIYVCMHACM